MRASERAALRLSAGGALILGATALGFSAATGSGAILLDGLFNLCFVVTALLTLRVATLVARPDDERYPFGYLFFEPLINTAKGLLLIGVSLFALVDAGIALMSGGRAVTFGPAIAYAAVATLACLAVAFVLAPQPPRRPEPARRRRRRDLDGQRRDLRRRPRRLPARRLPRPPRPRRRRGPRRPGDGRPRHPRLGRRPDPHGRAPASPRSSTAPPTASVVAGIEATVRGALGDLPLARLYVRAIQPGRTTYVVVHVLLPPGAALDLAAADRLRGAVIAALAARHAPVVADIVFTGVEAFAAPTAGYTA